MKINVDDCAVDRTQYESTVKAKGAANGIKHLVRKFVKALSMDGDGIFKSKDWPYLWRR